MCVAATEAEGTDTGSSRMRLVPRPVTAPGPRDTMAGPHEQAYLTIRASLPTHCARTVDAALQTVLQTV